MCWNITSNYLLSNIDTNIIRFPIIDSYCPKGILCGRRLETVVWNTSDDDDDDRILDHFCYCLQAPGPRDTLFGRHSEGIRDELKFRDRSLFQFTLIECTTWCVKNTLFCIKSPGTVNGQSFENSQILELFCRYIFTFLWAFFKALSTQKALRATLALRV